MLKWPIPQAPAGPRGAVPAWSDPTPLGYGTALRITQVALTVGTTAQILKADPTRIAFGIARGNSGFAQVIFGPTSDLPNGGNLLGTTWADNWLDIFTYGVLVQSAWFAQCNGLIDARIFEVYRL